MISWLITHLSGFWYLKSFEHSFFIWTCSLLWVPPPQGRSQNVFSNLPCWKDQVSGTGSANQIHWHKGVKKLINGNTLLSTAAVLPAREGNAVSLGAAAEPLLVTTVGQGASPESSHCTYSLQSLLGANVCFSFSLSLKPGLLCPPRHCSWAWHCAKLCNQFREPQGYSVDYPDSYKEFIFCFN